MRRRTLDIMFSTGGLLLAALLVILGLVLTNRADFARTYVGDQLGQESMTFKTADELSPEELDFTEARSGCAIEYAGQEVTTGKQAECYANEYLGGHLTWLATRLGMEQVSHVDGMNFVELGAEQGRLRTEIATAEQNNDPRLEELQQELDHVTMVRSKMFEGTMLRNALLTVYGFSELGEMAGTASLGVYVVAGLMLLLSIAGFIHALVTPKESRVSVAQWSDFEVTHRETAGI